MATRYVNNLTGSDAGAGTEEDPWYSLPGITGGPKTAAAGDIIRVRNGTVYVGQLALQANNLTYQGYGLAGNVLMVTKPVKGMPWLLYKHRVVREAGVHEGMWILDGRNITTEVLSFGSRSGCVIEDVDISGPISTNLVGMGFSTSTAIGCTLRRSYVHDGGTSGLTAYSRQITIEDVVFERIQDDAMSIGASVQNAYRAGYADVVRGANFIEVGLDTAQAIGDAFQTYAASDRYESPLLMEDIYVRKTSQVKQAIVVNDMIGGMTLRRFHFDGGSGGTCQFLIGMPMRGNITLEEGYANNGSSINPMVRMASATSGQNMLTGTTLTLKHLIISANGVDNNGLFVWGGSSAAMTVDGAVVIDSCYVSGTNASPLSFAGMVSSHQGALTTIGANASITVRNSIFDIVGPAIRLPTGGANSSKWKFENNYFSAGSKFYVDATEYGTLAAFQAAHSSATNNITSADPKISADFGLMLGSPLIEAGKFVSTCKRDISGIQRSIPPSIGPREFAKFRPKQ